MMKEVKIITDLNGSYIVEIIVNVRKHMAFFHLFKFYNYSV